jgi:hypothetical protein
LLVIGLAIWGIFWFGKNYEVPEAGQLPATEVREKVATQKARTEPRRKK